MLRKEWPPPGALCQSSSLLSASVLSLSIDFECNAVDTVLLMWGGRIFIFQLSEGSCPARDCWASPQVTSPPG